MTAIDAQLVEDINAIKALIQAFFDAINAEDTKALQSKFLPKANLTIVRQDPPLPPPGHDDDDDDDDDDEATGTTQKKDDDEEKEEEEKLTVVIRTSIEDFIRLVEDDQKRRRGRPQPVLHEAPDLDATEVRTDGLFGVAWSPFEVTFDGVLHHYGTMAYTLGRVDADVDTRDGQGKGKVWRVEGLTQSYRRTPGWAVGEEEGSVMRRVG